ncbi:hypothetical protein L484_001523 [Morus notabilis]|uniref:Uncharacterized protein n=1 Tax=Morus notabilis TaxID=981085 RepID=W9QNY9_9ROSA|nr:hypothetical protein L484_001523 [Morus notabilis]
MLPKSCQNKTTSVPNNSITSCNVKKPNFGKEIITFAPIFAHVNLTISSISTSYRAYANNDIAMVASIAFVFIGYFVLQICFRALNRLPQNEESTKKLLLKITAWGLSSAILFVFAYQFCTLGSLTMTVVTFGVVIAGSACIFFVYFIYDDKKNGPNVSNYSTGEKISTNSCSSCPDQKYNDHDKCTASALEKV